MSAVDSIDVQEDRQAHAMSAVDSIGVQVPTRVHARSAVDSIDMQVETHANACTCKVRSGLYRCACACA